MGIFVIFRARISKEVCNFYRLFCDTLKVGQGIPDTTLTEVRIMVEVEKDYASKGVAGAGLGLGK